jgi:hypothetical protein
MPDRRLEQNVGSRPCYLPRQPGSAAAAFVTRSRGAMPRGSQPTVRELLVELSLYAVMVVGYLWGVLLLIDHRVAELAMETGVTYAVVALALIVGQGFLLDIVVGNLLRFVRSWMDGR